MIYGTASENYNNFGNKLLEVLKNITYNKKNPLSAGEYLLERMILYTNIAALEDREKLIEDVLQYSYDATKGEKTEWEDYWRDSLANSIQTFAYIFQPLGARSASYGRSVYDESQYDPAEANPFKTTDCDLYVDWWLTFAATGGSYEKTCAYYTQTENIPHDVDGLVNEIKNKGGKEIEEPENITIGSVIVTYKDETKNSPDHISIVIENNIKLEEITYNQSTPTGDIIATMSYEDFEKGNYKAFETEPYVESRREEISEPEPAEQADKTPEPKFTFGALEPREKGDTAQNNGGKITFGPSINA